jgi:hypothetical protein
MRLPEKMRRRSKAHKRFFTPDHQRATGEPPIPGSSAPARRLLSPGLRKTGYKPRERVRRSTQCWQRRVQSGCEITPTPEKGSASPMTSERGGVRFITLADGDQQPLGVVAYGGADWTLNCGQCPHARPSTSPNAAVKELLTHIERAHHHGSAVEVVDVSDQAT